MPIIRTDLWASGKYSKQEDDWIYNALDCCVTLECWEEMGKLPLPSQVTYDFERGMQAPVLRMMQRGWLIDQSERANAAHVLEVLIEQAQALLNRLAHAVWGKDLNPKSPLQLQQFFYGAMRLPEQWVSKKGVKKLSTDRDTLEEKLDVYLLARPFISLILTIRDLSKQLEVFKTSMDSDGRMRCSYNIAGTDTGRLSSSASSTGTGRNLQNIAPLLRRMFIADPGWKLCGIDLEQAESREVGWLCGTILGDWSYLDACLSGDLHTLTCKLIWTDLPWTGDPKHDRQIADQLFYREFSYRDLSKRGGHGSNYYGTPFTMARHLKVPVSLMENFQRNYFGGFPGIPLWHQYVASTIQRTQKLSNSFGRERYFLGRTNDDTTLRAAIAYVPQSNTAERMNCSIWRLWEKYDQIDYRRPGLPLPVHSGTDLALRQGDSPRPWDKGRIQILHQEHDAVYFLYREEDEQEIIPLALKEIALEIRDPKSGRSLIVPGEAKVGWNRGNFASQEDKDAGKVKRTNLLGLKKLKAGTRDDRVLLPLLERIQE